MTDGQSNPQSVPVVSGRFSASGLLPGAVTLHAAAPGWVDLARTVDLPAGDHVGDITLRDVDLRLARGGIVLGTLTHSDGSAAANVPVRAGERRGRTDGDGHFRLDGVATGTVHVSTSGADAEVEVRAGEESTADLRLSD